MNHEQMMKHRLGMTAVTLGSVLVALVVVLIVKEIKSIAYVGTDPASPDTITVSGTGNAYAIPDIATFSFTVTQTAATVADAQAAATKQADSALAAVKTAGVADKDIQTTGYSISPQYEYSDGVCTPGGYCPSSAQKLTGYDVSETVQVKVRDLSQAGPLLSSLGSAGVQNLNGPDFSVDDPDSVQAEARASAISDAQSQAETLAKQLGVSLVRVTGFSENGGNYPEPLVYAMSASAGSVPAAAPQIATGQQEVTENVTITYQIR